MGSGGGGGRRFLEDWARAGREQEGGGESECGEAHGVREQGYTRGSGEGIGGKVEKKGWGRSRRQKREKAGRLEADLLFMVKNVTDVVTCWPGASFREWLRG